ncbi:phage tail sheath C-terminal domain-containing protein [Paenarthrobacter sp. PH39-S1]|uniref:phage tail sheath C-terminal domain-containing protein n=1 Tax=Paenarthrobacter sp. PH39-S1 TaxID=3046204 RepID=UPI0024B9A327|nr:phage tail sheath C-terminal domain-containing protein [Paenarthrobacter sp. PH39-S1]MDJ0355302.1 phage tail sheath C-terminal domain-containing protein [Paenarthrobacter sp. PH39-S1]
MTAGLQLGRPGIYPFGDSNSRPESGFEPVRLDETGFVGVALRGPVDRPIMVASWSDYVRNFGAFEREPQAPDRLLPYAVQAFFAQGGERAWVLRVAPPPDWTGDDAEAATARFRIGAGTSDASGLNSAAPWLTAASEGTWGTGLRVRLGFEVLQSFDGSLDDDGGIKLPAGAVLAPWSLLRLLPLDPPGLPRLGWVAGERRTDPRAGGRSAVLETPMPVPAVGFLRVDVVTAVLEAAESGAAQRERLSGMGLRPGHPRFLPDVLVSESVLLRATGDWGRAEPLPDPRLDDVPVLPVHPGKDRSPGIDFHSFYDDGPADQDPLDEACHRGVDALGRESRIGLLCVPDLYWRAAPAAEVPAPAPVRHAASCCCGCLDPRGTPGTCGCQASCGCRARGGCRDTVRQDPDYAPAADVPPALDARDPGDLAEIVRRQLRLVEVAELRHRFVALLDVPAGLSQRQIHDWRTGFGGSYAAAYFPWLGVPRIGPGRPAIVQLPPSSFAAGIIAARERRLGLSWGPANALAVGAVLSADVVSDATHDALHLQGINVYRQDRDGIRLSAARTLSTDPEYVQLSVRRLMTMLALTLERQAQWLVFEPNTPQLRTTLTRMLTAFLRDQHRRGAFAGGTEAESFFVQCDDGLNPPQSQGLGRLVAEVGVAPAFPLEYLVLRISQDVDGSVLVAGPGQEGGNA